MGVGVLLLAYTSEKTSRRRPEKTRGRKDGGRVYTEQGRESKMEIPAKKSRFKP